MTDLLIRNTRPMDGAPADILIRDGRIAAIGPDLAADGIDTEDAGGRIAIPGLVDAHTHLDKSLLGYPWVCERGRAALIDKIETNAR